MNFAWQGQSCGSTSRLFLHESIHDAFLEELVAKVGKIRLDDPMLEESQMGPINSKTQYEKVQQPRASRHRRRRALDDRREASARCGLQQGLLARAHGLRGCEAHNAHRPRRNLRPVLSVFKWCDLDEVLEVANDIEYGLTGAVWTKDVSTRSRSLVVSKPDISGLTALGRTSKPCRSAVSRTAAPGVKRGSKSSFLTLKKNRYTSSSRSTT